MQAASIIGITLDVVGTTLIAYTVLRVHYRVGKEHRIDEYVTKEMRRERSLGLLGVALILIGYAIQLTSYL